MLVAPLGWSARTTASPHLHPRHLYAAVRPRTVSTPFATAFVSIWLLIGIATMVLIPFARGDALFGATLPFWLVVAPLLDLVWLQRASVVKSLRRRARSARSHMATTPADMPRRQWRR